MAFNTKYAQTLHRHVVMWLDQYIGVIDNNKLMKDRFRRVTYPLETFTDVHSAINFIAQQQTIQKNVFLIVSDKLADEILRKIDSFDCVIKILILSTELENYTVDYIEIVLFFDSEEDLLTGLINKLANYLTKEADKYNQENDISRATGLLDWAAWLYNDANTLKYEKLAVDHKVVYRN